MKIAIIKIRGETRKPGTVCNTLKLLRLKKKNHLTIVEETPHLKGMLTKIEPYVTWGQIDEKTLAALKGKHALNPPKKGFGRKGVKMPFKKGGAYGNRAEKINDLLMRMM